jgi:hypothetical protein
MNHNLEMICKIFPTIHMCEVKYISGFFYSIFRIAIDKHHIRVVDQ